MPINIAFILIFSMSGNPLQGSNVPPTPKRPRITQEDKNSFKVMKLGHSTIPHTLTDIWNMGSSKDPNETLEHFFLNRIGMSMKKYKHVFNKFEREKMCSVDTMNIDVTQLYSLIKFGNQKLAGEHDPAWNLENSNSNQLEWLLSSIKNERNKMFHNTQSLTKAELLVKTEQIRSLLERALQVAGQLYEQSPTEVDEKIRKLKSEIIEIRDHDLSQVDIIDYRNKLTFGHLKGILQAEGREELKGIYKKWSQLNPAFFVQGEDLTLDVQSVFVRLVVEKAGDLKKGSLVPFESLIEFSKENTSGESNEPNFFPEVILVEGLGGVGKTTLTKLFMSQWSDGTEDILGLDQFDLVLLMECRNRKIDSFAELLSHLLPQTDANHFSQGDLLKCAQQLRLLVIIDGLDEINSSSQKVFRDILETQRTGDLLLLCTSRPEKVNYFYKMVPGEYQKVHLRILGIPDDCKGEFLMKYHNQMKAKGKSKQNTEDLVKYLRGSPECLRDHYRLPLNLVLLAWLWSGDPARVTTITTPTELYTKYLQFIQEKLIERLLHKESTAKMTVRELKQKIQKYQRTLYNEALRALKNDWLEKLPPESLRNLKDACDANSLPQEETLPAFLVLKLVEHEEYAIIPHKLALDFYVALGIMLQLFDQPIQNESNKMLQDLHSVLSSYDSPKAENILQYATATLEHDIAPQRPGAITAILSDPHSGDNDNLDLSKYQSVLVHLAGCLYIQTKHQVQDCTAQEIVQLLKRSGMGWNRDNEWFQLLDHTKNNEAITKYVAQEMKHGLDIDDSHVNVAINLLKYAKPVRVTLDIHSDPWEIPDFSFLLERISEENIQVDIYFHKEFRQPKTHITRHAALESIFKRCHVGQVMCGVDGPSLLALPSSVVTLSLPLATDEQAVDLLAALQLVHSTLPNLRFLYVHVGSGVSRAAVRPLPKLYVGLHLVLSDVTSDSIARTCCLTGKLQPEDGRFWNIRFPRARLGRGCWLQFLAGLKEQKVDVRDYLMLPPDSIDDKDRPELRRVAASRPFPYILKSCRSVLAFHAAPYHARWVKHALSTSVALPTGSVVTQIRFSSAGTLTGALQLTLVEATALLSEVESAEMDIDCDPTELGDIKESVTECDTSPSQDLDATDP